MCMPSRAVTTRLNRDLNMFSGQQFAFSQFKYIDHNVSSMIELEYPEFSSVLECAFPGGRPGRGLLRVQTAKGSLFDGLAFARVAIMILNIRSDSEVRWRQLPRARGPCLPVVTVRVLRDMVMDNLQTCPTMYKSGTLV
jgi:hypothetical protein